MFVLLYIEQQNRPPRGMQKKLLNEQNSEWIKNSKPQKNLMTTETHPPKILDAQG